MSAFQPSHGNSAFQPSPGNCFVVISFLSANDVKCTNSIFLCLPIVYHIHVSVICHHFCSCSDRLRRITHLQSFWFSHYTMHSFLSLFRARDYVLETVRTADSYLPASNRNVPISHLHELYLKTISQINMNSNKICLYVFFQSTATCISLHWTVNCFVVRFVSLAYILVPF